MIIPALPAIQHEFGASPEAATWLLTAFLLTSSISTPLLGRLGDMYGKEKLLLAALGVFAAGSLVSALGQSIGVLILGRAIQGAGGAIFPLAFGIIRDEFPPERVATSIGLISATFGIGGGLGLVLAGVMVDHLSVHWIFWSSVIVTTLAAWATWRYVPESPVRVKREDRLGRRRTALARADRPAARRVAGQRLGLGLRRRARAVRRGPRPRGRVRGLRAPGGRADGGHAAHVPAARLVHEPHRLRDRLRDVRLLRPDPPARGAALGHRLRLRKSTTVAGLIMLPSALVMLGAGPLSGWLGSRFGSRLPLALGGIFAALAYISLALFHETLLEIAVGAVLIGIGIGLAFAAMANLVVEAVRQDQTGVATGINTIMRSIGGSIGAQVAAAILAGNVILGGRFPAERASPRPSLMSAVAAVVALVATSLIPRPPRRAEAGAEQQPRATVLLCRGRSAPRPDGRALPRDVRGIAVVVIIGAVMSILDTTIVNVALQTLRNELDSPLSTIQWVSTGYLLALATAIPLTGWAAERFGPRRVWMSAVAAFVVTSGLCGLAWSAESLIGFPDRAVRGRAELGDRAPCDGQYRGTPNGQLAAPTA